MCIEVKRIKQQYSYDFSKLLILENDDEQTQMLKNNEIEKIASDLLASVLKKRCIEKMRKYPFATPIISISNYFGFIVLKGFFERLKDQYSDFRHISGMIGIDGKYRDKITTDKVILLNPNETPANKRFTVAHELGHYLFDFNETKDLSYCNYYKADDENPSAIEVRASRFAAALLMPKENFIKRYKYLRETEALVLYDLVNQLADDFIVSTKAVEKRINELGLNE